MTLSMSSRVTLCVCTILQLQVMIQAIPEFMTPKEKAAVDKFRPLVADMLTKDYMSTDAWLLTWLRAKKLSLTDAKKFLEKNMKWREQNNMDNFLDEDWSKFDRDYGYIRTCGVDRTGKPILLNRWGKINLRKAVLGGQVEQLTRYIIYHMFEEPMIQSYESSKAAAGGNLTIAVTYLMDSNGFNARTGLCLGCLPIQVAIATAYELHYPQMYDPLLLINTPVIFDTVLTAVKPFLTQYTKKDMIVLRHGKEVWAKDVDKVIAKDELPKELGGKQQCVVLASE